MSVPCSVVTNGRRRLCGQHLARQQRRDRMRDGVVDVQQVQVVALGHFGHARGQRQRVGRVLEQRVGRDLDLVVVDARSARVEPDGVGVGDEVDLVAAVGQFQAQFGGDDAAAAVGGITGDSDLHLARLTSPASEFRRTRSARSGSRPAARTSPPPNQTRTPSGATSTVGIADHLRVPRLIARNHGGSESRSQRTPSRDRARPMRRFSRRSRPV